jgi:hypothetical protein
MARVDKNKHNASGGGSSNSSNQGFLRNRKHQKSDRNKTQTGGWPSEPQEPGIDAGSDRSRSSDPEQQTKSSHTNDRKFSLVVDSVPYLVQATPYKFNGETRYRVSFNGGSEHVFTWDSSMGQLRAIDDEASTLPDNLEEAISEKLQ